MTELAIFGLGAAVGAAVVLLVCVICNFVSYHRDRRIPTAHIWQIAMRGRKAGSNGG